jgi:hypothetical protein
MAYDFSYPARATKMASTILFGANFFMSRSFVQELLEKLGCSQPLCAVS